MPALARLRIDSDSYTHCPLAHMLRHGARIEYQCVPVFCRAVVVVVENLRLIRQQQRQQVKRALAVLVCPVPHYSTAPYHSDF